MISVGRRRRCAGSGRPTCSCRQCRSRRRWRPLVAAFAPFGFLMHRAVGAAEASSRSSSPKRSTCCRARIRAGHAFQTAMGMVADELPEPVGPEFKKTFDQQNFGLPLRDALNELAERVPHARRAVLRHRRADSARDRRQPVGDSRQPGARRARALQDPAAGARPHRARPLHRLRAAGAAGGARRRADRSSTPST